MGKKGPLWWRESDWLLRGSSAANQILLRHSGPILSIGYLSECMYVSFSGRKTMARQVVFVIDNHTFNE